MRDRPGTHCTEHAFCYRPPVTRYLPVANPQNRFSSTTMEYDDLDVNPGAPLEVYEDKSRSILASNDSPDVGFKWSVNPYRGCFHACAYCYARPSHEYLGLGAGSDFERKIVVKRNAADLLREAFDKKSWKGEHVVFSGVTDCYQPLEAEPGKQWEYSSATTVILADLAARMLTASTDPAERARVVRDYLHTRLFEPLGMTSMVPEFDAAGTLIGGSLIHGSARDWSRLGEFMRNAGAVKGAQLVPVAWIDFMTSAAPGNAGYGGQLWRNQPQPDGFVLWPGTGAGTFSLNGHLGQFVVISRSNAVTVVRLGKTNDGQHPPVRRAIARIIQLFRKDQGQ